MKLFEKHPRTRWILPAGVAVAVIGATLATGAFADNSPDLPERSAHELVADVLSADIEGFQGSVVTHADMGLPAIPVTDAQSAEFATLVAGSHTLRLWVGDEERVRIAMLGEASESDFIRNGDTLWTWSSEQNAAVRMSLPESEQEQKALPSQLPTTPQGIAKKFLDELEPTTEISVHDTERVAGRSAYELQLEPQNNNSLIGAIQISVDAETSLPLQVEVYAQDSSTPAFEIGFTQISFADPSDEHFEFTPPDGASVTDMRDEYMPNHEKGPTVTTEGEMWDTVFIVKDLDLEEIIGASTQLLPQNSGGEEKASSRARDMLKLLPRVSGEWGTGRLLTSALFTVLITEDRTVYVGPVTQDRLYEVANSHE